MLLLLGFNTTTSFAIKFLLYFKKSFNYNSELLSDRLLANTAGDWFCSYFVGLSNWSHWVSAVSASSFDIHNK